MRFKKTTLAALCLAFASAVAYSAAGDRFFSNPTLNKDVVIQVNKAGVTTDVIKAVGSTGAVTVDISGSTNIHTLFGRTLLLNDVNNSGAPSLVLRAKSTAGSTENYSINVDATDNSNKGLYFDVPQGKIFFRGTSFATTGSVTGAGAWEFGTAGVASTHAAYGRLAIQAPTGIADGTDALRIGKFSTTTTTSQVFVLFQTNNAGANSGSITANGANAATFTATSDVRLKMNIKPTTLGSLAKIDSLRPVEFDYRDGTGHQWGFVAQEMEKVFPQDVSEGKDGMKSIAGWGPQMSHLVGAIKELKAQHEALQADNDALKSRIKDLEDARGY